jgi:hypothetical protein
MGELEYRVVWKRKELSRKTRRFRSLKTAEKFRGVLTAGSTEERLLLLGKDPDAYYCCDGHECGCGGETNRESEEHYADGMPLLEYCVIEERPVGPWEMVLRPAVGQEREVPRE